MVLGALGMYSITSSLCSLSQSERNSEGKYFFKKITVSYVPSLRRISPSFTCIHIIQLFGIHGLIPNFAPFTKTPLTSTRASVLPCVRCINLVWFGLTAFFIGFKHGAPPCVMFSAQREAEHGEKIIEHVSLPLLSGWVATTDFSSKWGFKETFGLRTLPYKILEFSYFHWGLERLSRCVLPQWLWFYPDGA